MTTQRDARASPWSERLLGKATYFRSFFSRIVRSIGLLDDHIAAKASSLHVSRQSCDQHFQKEHSVTQTFPNAIMAEAQPRGGEEEGPRPALDLSASASTPLFSFSFSLKIADRPLAAGALVGIGVAAIALGALYYKNPELVTGAVRGALEGPGLQVANIAPGSIIVELLCNKKDSFLTFVEDFESKKVKQRLEKEFKKIGFKEELDVTIANDKQVYDKLDQIR